MAATYWDAMHSAHVHVYLFSYFVTYMQMAQPSVLQEDMMITISHQTFVTPNKHPTTQPVPIGPVGHFFDRSPGGNRER